MITNENELINLIKNTYSNAIIEHNKFGELIVKKDKRVECRFSFRFYEKESCLNSVAERFINHNCLSMGFQYNNDTYYGGCRTETCDNQDLSKQVLEIIDNHIKLDRKKYEQLSLW